MNETRNHLSERALTPYLDKFKLHMEPFSNEVNDDFFLLDSQRSQHLNMLYHLAQNSELMLLVTGKEGSGKTSLLQHFINMGDETWRNCIIDANAMMNPEQLLIQIAEGFGLPQDTVKFSTGIEMLNKRLIEMKRSELISILIIDDAHELPAASLTMLMKLSELSDEHEGLLRFVLFSEPQLVDILNASSFKDVRYRVTHTLEMPSLNEQETINYIQHRLTIAGLKDKNPFSKSQLKRIYRVSSGLPGKINQLAHQTLLGTQSKTPKKDPATNNTNKLRSSITVLLILTISIGITWFFSRDAFNKLSEHLTKSDAQEYDAVTMMPQTTKSLPLMPAKPLASAHKPENKNSKNISKGVSVTESRTTNSTNAYALRQPDIKTKSITTIDKPEVLVAENNTKKTNTSVTATKPIEPTKSVVASPVTTAKTINLVATKPPVLPAPKKTSVVPKATSTKPLARSWVSQQNPKHFTLQVMGSHERRSLYTVIRGHKLNSKTAAILHTRLKNKDWYILVYGSYPNRDTARAAVKSLPQGLQITKPWPRQISGIKLVK